MKKVAILLIAATVALSFPAHAGIQQALDSMFQSNVTTPGAYQSATRGGYVGGGISLRTPVKPINLVAFDPPRFSAGCGGIDMYGGSFTFINKNQFTALLRQIMNNAIGLLFQAALQNISPSMSSLLDSFQKKLQELNALASNTCQIANQVVDFTGLGDALSTKAKKSGASVGATTGSWSDLFAGEHPESQAQSKTDNRTVEDKNPAAGNFTWRALHRSQVSEAIGMVGMVADPGDPNGVIAKQFIMSLLGTAVSTSYKPETNAANTTQPSYDATFGPKFGLVDLIAAEEVKVYSCASSPAVGGDADGEGPHSCVNVTPEIALDFAGTIYYVRNMLYGDSTQVTVAGIKAAIAAHSPDNPGANSIYGRIVNCSTPGCGMSTKEQNFLQLSAPVFNIMKDAQSDLSTMRSLSEYIEMPLAVMIAEKMGEATIRAAKTAWNGVPDVNMPPNVRDNIISLERQMENLHQIAAEYRDQYDKARVMADNVRKYLPSVSVQ